MTDEDASTPFGTYALRALSFALGLLPEGVVSLLAWAGGALWWHVLRYRRGVIEANLAQAFGDLSRRRRRRLGLAACRHLLRTLFEVFRLPRYRRRGFASVVRAEGMEHFFAARAEGRGVLCLSGHLGSWELGVAGVAAQAGEVSLVVKSFGPAFERFITGLRTSAGLRVIHRDGAVRPILRALRNGEAVVFVLDQNATRSIGVFVDFFGKQACTMTTLAVLAQRTGAAVVPCIPRREAAGRHVIEVRPPIPFEPQADSAATLEHMTQVYTRHIEDAIRACPAQWFWTHKRWRTRPASTPSLRSSSAKASSDAMKKA